MRGLAVIFRCINYMGNSLGKVKTRTTRHGQCGWFGPDYAISRACHRLEGNSFAFSENRTKVTLLDPPQVKTLS